MNDIAQPAGQFDWPSWLDRFKLSPAQGRALVALAKANALPSRTVQALARRHFAEAKWDGAHRVVAITPVGRAALEWLDPLSREHEAKK